MKPLTPLALCGALVAGHLALVPAHAAAPAGSTPRKAELKIGAPAPAFKVGRWVKGAPIPALAKGRVYVVEFWATWCGPCKMTIPHLTELAKQYQEKVTFIGVDIMESGHGNADATKIDEKVDNLVTTMGAKMDYPVCRDTAEKTMESTWYQAGKFPGIPACVVVDGTGKIAWMGHPMNLDEVIPAVLAGGFDGKSFNEAVASRETTQKAFLEALREKDWASALAAADKLPPSKNPEHDYKDGFRFQALLHLDQQRAEALFASLKDNAAKQPHLVQILATETGLDKVWYQRAITILEMRSQAEKDYLSLLARAYHQAGETSKAVRTQKDFIAWLQAEKAKDPEKAPAYDYQLREARGDLAEFQPE